MKNSFHDRQLTLINTARVLKFLESYALRQTKLWKVLSKYHNLLDHFHDLKTTLQTEFELLKTATLKNIQNLQETVQAQQAYMMVLSGHIAALHTKLAHLDKQIQIHCIYPHPQSDAVQLSALDYDPDIDGEPNSINAIQPPNADSKKKMSQVPQNQKTTLPFALLPIGLSISPQKLSQIARPMNLTMQNNNEQNTRVITAHN